MCGINGYLDFKKNLDIEKIEKIVHLMNEQIKYRGPDEEGIYTSDSLCIGMRRLSILDIKDGSQPIYNEDKTLAVIYNGEIYNFQEIKKELEEKGHRFRTNTDTEVIVHCFEEYGTKAFDLFDGMYAFALYDRTQENIYLVRDRMGEKPLYYYIDDECLLFGSELKSLLITGKIKKEISIRALNQFLQLTYIPAPLSIFKNVWKLRPGHYLKINKEGKWKDCEYWNIPVRTPQWSDYKKAKKKLYLLLRKSVKRRMVSDVPVGAFLSGGVDSGSIVGLMSKISDKKIDTFTIGSSIQEYDERSRANEIVKKNGTNHHEKIFDYAAFPAIVDMIISQMDEPFADSSELSVYLLSEYVKDSVTVVLTGDAGDEIFAGYNKYLFGYYSKIYRKIPVVFREKIIKPIVHSMKDTNRIMRKIRKVIDNVEKDPCECHKALMCMGIKMDEIGLLLKSQYRDEHSFDFIDDYYNQFPEASALQKALYTDLKVVLEGDMLVKTDRMSMRHSIETRIPMLAKEIIEFSINLPDKFKLKGRNRKRILKDSMRIVLPKNFDKYPKSGFEVPVDHWLRNEMKEEVERVFAREKIEKQGLFKYEYIRNIINEHFSGKRNRKDELWVLYVFEKWYEEVME